MIKLNNELYDLTMRQTRALLHQKLDRLVYDSEDITEEMEEELAEAHELISAQDEKALDNFMIGYDIYLESAPENTQLEEALKEAGYKVQGSNVSRSLYVINDEGEEVRIADHKRPSAPTVGGNDVEHQYENELIVEDNKVNSEELSKFSIELEEGEYILG